MKKTDVIAALAAFAQENRLDVFRLLVQAGPEGMPAGEVADALDLAPNNLTFHFDRLREAGLVTVRREGRSMIYAARFEVMNDLIVFLTDNCCQGAACAATTGKRTRAKRSKVLIRRSSRNETHARSRLSPKHRQRHRLLFGAVCRQAGGLKDDYAKWMLDDPRMNFAISTRGREPGLDHLGIQVESEGELQEVYGRLREAGGDILEEGKTTCCYAKSEKSWIDDPAGISWETFFTTGESIHYGDSVEKGARVAHAKACCGPDCCEPAAEPVTDTASACCAA